MILPEQGVHGTCMVEREANDQLCTGANNRTDGTLLNAGDKGQP